MINRLRVLFFVLLFIVAIAIGALWQNNSLNNDKTAKKILSPLDNIPEEVVVLPSVTPLPTEKQINLIIAGDFMFDRYIRQIANEKGYDFILKEMESVLEEADFVIVNLEGSITNYPSVSMYSKFGSKENYIFTLDPKVIDILKKFNMVVGLGNNHILNFGPDGLSQTVEYLNTGGVKYFGQVGQKDVSNYVVIEKDGLKVALVNYNQFINDDKEEVFNAIGTLNEESDFLVVYTHWGNEYALKAGEVIVDLAHEFIDMGADLVVGSHPHVVQQMEEYRNKKIYYSLGNFVFDQYFDEETMKGMLVSVDLAKLDRQNVTVTYEDIPIKLSPNGQTLRLN